MKNKKSKSIAKNSEKIYEKFSTIGQKLRNIINRDDEEINIANKDERIDGLMNEIKNKEEIIQGLIKELDTKSKTIHNLEQTQKIIEDQFQIKNEEYKDFIEEIKNLKCTIKEFKDKSSLSLRSVEEKEDNLKEYKIYTNSLEKELDRSNKIIAKILKKGKFKRRIIDIKEIEIV